MPQVSGRVVEVNPSLEPGGVLPAGAVAVKLERADYELALRQAELTLATRRNALADAKVALEVSRHEVTTAQSALDQANATVMQAEASYRIELGEQDVAKYAWDMAEGREEASEQDRELALREPYLTQAKATVASAKAGLASAEAKLEIAKEAVTTSETAVNTAKINVEEAEAGVTQARLDLARTNVSVPFDAVVAERAVSVGAQVSTGTALAVLVERAAFWVEVSIPYDRLKWIQLPKDGQPGAAATVRLGGSLADTTSWRGEVVRCLPAIEESGRKVRLLVRVPDPLGQNAIPLLLNAFVTLDIAGPELEDVFVIPRRCIHNGNEVWVRNTEGRLAIQTIQPIWGDEDTVLIRDGVTEGDQLVTSDISSPVAGLKLALPAIEALPDGSATGGQGSD
jgi:multidrug resistance efflux pump